MHSAQEPSIAPSCHALITPRDTKNPDEWGSFCRQNPCQLLAPCQIQPTQVVRAEALQPSPVDRFSGANSSRGSQVLSHHSVRHGFESVVSRPDDAINILFSSGTTGGIQGQGTAASVSLASLQVTYAQSHGMCQARL